MPKSAGAKKRRRDETWTGIDHAIRQAKHQSRLGGELTYRERRAAALARGSKVQSDLHKLRLHIVKTGREVDKLRERLRTWDDVEEAEREKNRREEERKSQEQQDETSTKGRKGPESWKLRGAARPAWEVCDFDTRYVDPHVKAHEDAHKKAK